MCLEGVGSFGQMGFSTPHIVVDDILYQRIFFRLIDWTEIDVNSLALESFFLIHFCAC